MKKLSIYLCLAGLTALASACGGSENQDNSAAGVDTVIAAGDDPNDTVVVVGEEPTDAPTGFRAGQRAVAYINGKSGTSVTGRALFTQIDENKVRMVLTVDNVPPGVHAVHLHQKGDCTAPDATSAGPHWNPTNNQHGNRETAAPHHKGDLPNFTAGADGRARVEREVEGWTIGGDDSTRNIVNHAIIIHAKADDYQSQPAGNAGDRIGCGVIALEEVNAPN